MSDTRKKDHDESKVTIIGHLCIRDLDSDQTILRKRDVTFKKEEHDRD